MISERFDMSAKPSHKSIFYPSIFNWSYDFILFPSYSLSDGADIPIVSYQTGPGYLDDIIQPRILLQPAILTNLTINHVT